MRYIKLYIELVKQSLIRAMIYKENFVTVLISNLAYFLIQLIFIKVVFQQVDTVAGWSQYEMIFYIGTFAIIDALWVFGPYFNLMEIPNLIRTGDLDGYLLKPVNSQFLVSLRKVDIGSVFSIFAGIVIVIYAAVHMHITLSIGRLGLYIIALFHALLVEYAIYLMLLCLAFWLVKADFAETVHSIVCYFSNKPVDIYRGLLRRILTFILPYGFLMTVATKSVIGKIESKIYVSAIILSWCFFALSIVTWHCSLKRYGSASS